MRSKLASRDTPTDLELLMSELDRLEGCEATKRRVRALLQAQVGRVIRFSWRTLVRPEQIEVATHLLGQRAPVREVRERLMARFGCSPRHAYNIIAEALRERAPAAPGAPQPARQYSFFEPQHADTQS